MHNFKELNVWKDSMKMAKEIYTITKTFPIEEKFSIISQLNRASISIPSNIAEGAGRDSKKEFNQFLNIALGSAYELETQLILSNEFGYLEKEKLTKISADLSKLQRMISALKKSLK